MRFFLIISCLIFFTSSLGAQTMRLERVWESKENLPVPESVLYVEEKGELYVSLIDGEGTKKDGKGGVAILNLDGSVQDSTWVTGLNAPKGMSLYEDRLYVADISEVVVIDVKNGEVVERIEIEGAVFLNDVTVDERGVVYISDTRENRIYRMENGEYSVYQEDVRAVNGLKCIGNDLYALAGTRLLQFDENKKETVIAEGFDEPGDGVESVGNGDFLVTCWAGLIYYVQKDGVIQMLLDVRTEMNTADLGYNQKDRLLYVPTFNANSVVAYRLN